MAKGGSHVSASDISEQAASLTRDLLGRLQTGSLVIVPAGAVRSIFADSRMRVLAMQVP